MDMTLAGIYNFLRSHNHPIRHFISTLVVTLHLRPSRSTDRAGLDPPPQTWNKKRRFYVTPLPKWW